jgi:IS30 family transposase
MGEMPIPSYPMQVVGMDLIGPLVESENKNKYILTMIDHLSGWAECYAIKNKTSQAVEEKLAERFFPTHGVPEVMINDQGQEFNSNELRRYLKSIGVD